MKFHEISAAEISVTDFSQAISPLRAYRAGGTRQVDLPPARFKACGSRELRSVQGEEEQGIGRDCSRRVEVNRRIEKGVQQGTVDSPRQGALKSRVE